MPFDARPCASIPRFQEQSGPEAEASEALGTRAQADLELRAAQHSRLFNRQLPPKRCKPWL